MQFSNLPNHQLRPSSDSYHPDLLLSLLRARYVPDTFARQELRAFVAQGRQESAHGYGEDGLAMLLCTALLAPIRQLPPELLERIFSYALAPTSEVQYERSPALWLSQVCKLWRDVASGTFDLTTRVTLPLKESSNTQSRFESLQLYLQSYPFSPLHVQLHFGPDEPQDRRSFSLGRRNELERYLPLMMQHQRRWSKLEILDKDRHDVVPPIRHFLQVAFNPPETHFGSSEGVVSSPNGMISTSSPARAIRELVLLTPSYSDFIPQLIDQDNDMDIDSEEAAGPTYTNPFNLPWTTLTSLTIRCTAPSIQHLITLGLSLQTLSVLVDLPKDDDPNVTSNVLTKVTSNTIQEFGLVFDPYCGPHVLPRLLSTLSLPSLTSLSLESKTDNTYAGNILPTSILHSFLAQSPGLQSLTIKSIPITATTLIASLPSAPNLTTLDCDFAGIRHVDSIAEGLCLPPTPQRDAKPLVPNLTSINLGVVQQSTAIRISSVVRSRAHRARSTKPYHRASQIKKVGLVSWSAQSPWLHDLEKELRSVGVEDVRLSSWSEF